MAQISRHKLLAPPFVRLEVGGGGLSCLSAVSSGGSAPRPHGCFPTHILPGSLRPSVYTQKGVGLLLGG